nr:MAG TPA: hypothetical protein [Bacteriophage sp.]
MPYHLSQDIMCELQIHQYLHPKYSLSIFLKSFPLWH